MVSVVLTTFPPEFKTIEEELLLEFGTATPAALGSVFIVMEFEDAQDLFLISPLAEAGRSPEQSCKNFEFKRTKKL